MVAIRLATVTTLPSYTAPLVYGTDLLLAALVAVGSVLVAKRAGLPAAVRRRIGALVAGVLAAWFAVAFALAQSNPAPRSVITLTAIIGPVVVATVALRDPRWRRMVRATPQRWLVGVQAYRVIGALFLVLWGAGLLPAYFALPAGVGDVVTGVGAVLVAAGLAAGVRGGRAATLVWNVVGLGDLVVAVGAGSTLLAGPLAAVTGGAGSSTAILVAVPLGLIPLFLVPISATLHVYSLSNLLAGRGVDADRPVRTDRTADESGRDPNPDPNAGG
jgi:hypothetical protein